MQKYFGKFCTIHGLIRVLHVGTQVESIRDSACKIFLTNCIQITKKCSQKLKNIWNILKLILFRKNAYLSTWLHVHYQHVHCLHVNTCSLSTCTLLEWILSTCTLPTCSLPTCTLNHTHCLNVHYQHVHCLHEYNEHLGNVMKNTCW